MSGLELRFDPDDPSRPIAIVITPPAGGGVKQWLNRAGAITLAVDLIALAAIAQPVEARAAYEVLGDRLRGITLRLNAAAAQADVELGIAPPQPDEHAPESIVGPHPSSGDYAGVCRCGHWTPPRSRKLTAMSTLCAHILNPERTTP